MITGHNILCISSIDWDFIWQGHQQIMATFAANGNRVLFVENTGVRRLRMRDLPRVRSRIRNWWRGTNGFREEQPNLFVFSPVVLPFPYSRVAQWINRVLLLRSLRRWMRAAGFHNPIVWTFLPTPLARDLIREIDPKLTIYYCIDDFSSSSHAARKITRTENRVFQEADLVLVTSEKLRRRAAQFNSQVHLFPFAVDYEAFERVRLMPDAVPPEVRNLPKPVIGYVGGLHQWVDQTLVSQVADAMPGASVVLIGPPQTDVSAMQSRPNVHLLGPRPHSELARYIKGFDVGLVPYRLSEYTAHVYPTKLNEYLAMGIPVVATDLPEIRRFNSAHGGVVSIAQGEAEFTRAVRTALTENTADAVEPRLAVARENSWASRIERMSVLIEAALAARRSVPWDERLRRFYRTTRRHVTQAVVGVSAVFALLFYTPLLWVAARPLLLAAPPQPASAIVAFGGGVGESGEAGSSYQERVKQAVALYHAGAAPRIVFSSGFIWAFPEAEVMKALAVAQGVPASAIILEQRAASTRENVEIVRNILDAHDASMVLLVSSPYHMRRAVLAWRKLAPAIGVTPTPVTESLFYQHRVGANPSQVRAIAHEYLALAYYWARGWI